MEPVLKAGISEVKSLISPPSELGVSSGPEEEEEEEEEEEGGGGGGGGGRWKKVKMKLIPIVYTAQAIVYTAQVCSMKTTTA